MNQTQDLSFIVPLSFEAHRLAEAQLQSTAQRAKQAYLNSLAVYAVDYYLRCLGWEPDRQASATNSPLTQRLMDVADLLLPGLGRLECRAVLPGQVACEIPPETWEDRIGYIAVQFDQSLQQAEILGFVQTPTDAVPLVQLQSLDHLLMHLEQIQLAVSTDQPIRLRQWLDGLFTAGWQAIETLLPQPELELVFRSDANQPILTKGFKVIQFADEQPVAILVMTSQFADDGHIDMQLELQPVAEQPFLPIDLEIAVLDAQGRSFLTAETREDNPPLQLEFSGDAGDTFAVRITLGEHCVTDNFLLYAQGL